MALITGWQDIKPSQSYGLRVPQNICFCLAAAREKKTTTKKPWPMFFLSTKCRLMSQMQSFPCKSAQKPCLFRVRESACVYVCARTHARAPFNVYATVVCVSLRVFWGVFSAPPPPPAPSAVPVRQEEQQANCGGREPVRAVSLADVNMAMLSWHRT